MNQEDHDVKVLIAEDNQFNSLALVALFQQYQLNVDVAKDGLEAVELVKKRFEKDGTTYPLIVLDIKMPNCDGLKSAKMINDYLKKN